MLTNPAFPNASIMSAVSLNRPISSGGSVIILDLPSWTTNTPSGDSPLKRESTKVVSSYKPPAISMEVLGSSASMMTTSNLSSFRAPSSSFCSSSPNRSTNQRNASSYTALVLSSSKHDFACAPSSRSLASSAPLVVTAAEVLPSKSVQSDHSGMYSLHISASSRSISSTTASVTDLCLRTSRSVAPSPPPMMATCLGWACASMAGWTMLSW
mmetsp:Transcript_31667/g.66342  ORF Transcript_31667/g.66342 Transcript_31667/m.66342 type:complete len:212 (+) Transcript_31667:3816-4451(+)